MTRRTLWDRLWRWLDRVAERVMHDEAHLPTYAELKARATRPTTPTERGQ